MKNNILELAKQCPNVNITLTAADLVETINHCISATRKELEQVIADANAEKYVSRKKAAEILDINTGTLWRWGKLGVLTPLLIGGLRRYKMSDINRLLEKKKIK